MDLECLWGNRSSDSSEWPLATGVTCYTFKNMPRPRHTTGKSGERNVSPIERQHGGGPGRYRGDVRRELKAGRHWPRERKDTRAVAGRGAQCHTSSRRRHILINCTSTGIDMCRKEEKTEPAKKSNRIGRCMCVPMGLYMRRLARVSLQAVLASSAVIFATRFACRPASYAPDSHASCTRHMSRRACHGVSEC